jgi:hypothetical protein
MSRFNLALLALAAAGGCSSPEAIGPRTAALSPSVTASAHEADSPSRHVLTYEKWITTSLEMAGNVNGVAGAFTGTILQRIVSADPLIVHLVARYVVVLPERDGASFTAVVEGDQNLHTNTAVLRGFVTDGWRTGTPVLVNYDVFTPCTLSSAPAGLPRCFRGTIRIGKHEE